MKISKKRLKELAAIKDEDIDTSDIPEFGKEFWEKAVVEFPAKKTRVTIRVDDYILDWFKRFRQKKGGRVSGENKRCFKNLRGCT